MLNNHAISIQPLQILVIFLYVAILPLYCIALHQHLTIKYGYQCDIQDLEIQFVNYNMIEMA
jgi:hypothetical protein